MTNSIRGPFLRSGNFQRIVLGDKNDLATQISTTNFPPRLIPLAYSRIQNTSLIDEIPLEKRNQFKSIQRATLAGNLRYLHLWDEIKKEFSTAGIKVVPLKGIQLLEMGIYNIGERPVSDLDILVGSEHFVEAESILQTMGLTKHRQLQADEHCNNLTRDRLNVGIHRRVLTTHRYFGIATDGLEERMLESSEPTILLFHLIAHLIYAHGFCGSIQLIDILLVHQRFRGQINYGVLRQLAEENCMEFGFALFNQLLLREFSGFLQLSGFEKMKISPLLIHVVNGIIKSSLVDELTWPHQIIPLLLAPNSKMLVKMLLRILQRRRHRVGMQL
jgi:hypothetical protein